MKYERLNPEKNDCPCNTQVYERYFETRMYNYILKRSVDGISTVSVGDFCEHLVIDPHNLDNINGVERSLQKIAKYKFKEKYRSGEGMADSGLEFAFYPFAQITVDKNIRTCVTPDLILDIHGDPYRPLPDKIFTFHLSDWLKEYLKRSKVIDDFCGYNLMDLTP